MINENIMVDKTIKYLNELLVLDKRAIENLFNIRAHCTRKLAEHPSVQVGKIGKNCYVVGILGILNGLFGTDENGYGPIAMNVDEGDIKKFGRYKEEN